MLVDEELPVEREEEIRRKIKPLVDEVVDKVISGRCYND